MNKPMKNFKCDNNSSPRIIFSPNTKFPTRMEPLLIPRYKNIITQIGSSARLNVIGNREKIRFFLCLKAPPKTIIHHFIGSVKKRLTHP